VRPFHQAEQIARDVLQEEEQRRLRQLAESAQADMTEARIRASDARLAADAAEARTRAHEPWRAAEAKFEEAHAALANEDDLGARTLFDEARLPYESAVSVARVVVQARPATALEPLTSEGDNLIDQQPRFWQRVSSAFSTTIPCRFPRPA
jgi:hypothetical protein